MLWTLPGSARAQLYVTVPGVNTIGENNATTGAVIKPNFITGLDYPTYLLLSGNKLYVANEDFPNEEAGSVGGIQRHHWIYHELQPLTVSSAVGLPLWGNDLYVSGGSIVGEYNASTGASIKPKLITGLNSGSGGVVGLIVIPPPCTLVDTASYDATTSTLTMNFTVGNTSYSDATWNAWLTYQNTMESLFSESLPITNPPQAVTKTKTDLSAEGEVGVLSTLTTPTQGIVCSSFVQTNTGTP